MDKYCKVTFDQYDQKIIVDFLLDENQTLKVNTYFDPELEDESKPVGPAAALCTIFLEALYAKNNTDNEQPDTKEPSTESES